MSNAATRSRAPLWLRAVNKLERTIGEPLESALHSDPYFDLVTDVLRLRDIRRMREQLGRVERRLAELSKELEDSENGRGARAELGGA